MSTNLNSLALQIDDAIDRLDIGKLHEARESICRVSEGQLSTPDRAALQLFSANIAAALRQAASDHERWGWIQPHLEYEILHLRQGLTVLGSMGTNELKTDLRQRLATNLANALNHVGRFVEAIETWRDAITEYPEFAMAIGNRAQAHYWYARYAATPMERALLLRESFLGFKDAVAIGVERHADEDMRRWLAHLTSMADWEDPQIAFPSYRTGSTKIERRYRKWCSQNTLVLSLINDLTTDLESIQDTLTLPNIIISRKDANSALPAVYSIFNQLKQEFTSARFLVFEAIQQKDARLHFADRGVILFDALDYRYYRLWIEKLKMAFLATHAILDKLAYLVNEYWKLGLKVRELSFNSVWYKEANPRLGLSDIFTKSENWPLRGLYWLSRDFHYKPKTLHAVSPEAKVIHDIRNHIAHKYLRVHDHALYDSARERAVAGSELSFPVSEVELQNHTLRLLKLVRSAMIYVSTAVAHEEKVKAEKIGSGLVRPMPMATVGDRYRL